MIHVQNEWDRQCWASLYSARSLLYRAARRADAAGRVDGRPGPGHGAADTAGVVFTANPVTGADDIVIEAASGVGALVVSGEVNRASGSLERFRKGRKDRAIAADGSIAAVDEARQRARCLDDRALDQLAAIALAIERHFGAFQDIEWARSDGAYVVLQARPMTGLAATG